jgi:hypothetical protein
MGEGGSSRSRGLYGACGGIVLLSSELAEEGL